MLCTTNHTYPLGWGVGAGRAQHDKRPRAQPGISTAHFRTGRYATADKRDIQIQTKLNRLKKLKRGTAEMNTLIHTMSHKQRSTTISCSLTSYSTRRTTRCLIKPRFYTSITDDNDPRLRKQHETQPVITSGTKSSFRQTPHLGRAVLGRRPSLLEAVLEAAGERLHVPVCRQSR